MKATQFIFLIPLYFFLTGFEKPDAHQKNFLKTPLFDTSIIAVIPYTTSMSGSILIKGKPAELTSADMAKIEAMLKKAVEEFNGVDTAKYFHIDLKDYRRQYIATLNEKREKVVWINCFCHLSTDWNWKKDLLFVNDGGECYFNVKINLTTRKYYNFQANGIAGVISK